ncbi:homeobox protein Hox-D3 [Anolis carolinensis]|uniref:homeobox protein Hox-D3 n=1 Tax=Anolis carolinensis TaxID=28377 RepID=UPI002F2B482C
MKASFQLDAYPDHPRREKLAEKIGVEEGRVAVWFQNRRARYLKDEKGKGKKAKQTRSARRVAPQSRARALPSPIEVATERAASQSSWAGHLGTHPQLGQTWPRPNYLFPQNYACGNSQFGRGQATAFSHSSHRSPCVQNSPCCFGAGAQDASWRPQQQSQPDYAAWDTGFHLGPFCDQGQGFPVEAQQLGEQLSVVQDSTMNIGHFMDNIRPFEEDGGCVVPSTPGSSPALPGDVASMRQELSPLGSSSSNQPPYPVPPYPQWGALPEQEIHSHWQSYEGPFQMTFGSINTMDLGGWDGLMGFPNQ